MHPLKLKKASRVTYIISKTCRSFQVQAYVKEWLQYQALWDLQADHLYGELGEDVAKWMHILTDIRQCRTTFDTSETRRTFGPIVVNYSNVQVNFLYYVLLFFSSY